MGGKNINSGILDINVNIRYKCSFSQKSLVQSQIPKLNNERQIVSNKRIRQSNERIAFVPGSET